MAGSSAPTPRSASDDTQPAAPRSLVAGRILGRYVVIEPIGEGGMANVYRAYDPRLAREVAIKLMRWDDAESAARIVREAQTMAQLAHPNVVPVFAVERAGGDLFLTMELVRGGTVRQWLLESPRSWREVLDVFVAAGRGLAAAHALGIVHRDFKPANVLFGEDGRARVTDFGLARGDVAALESSSPSLTSSSVSQDVTRHGAVMGTPPYMAPEQHRGEISDPRVDQFAFCVSLYEALFACRPFDADARDRWLPAKLRGPRAAPVRSDVPSRVVRAVLRGLAPSPDARWPDMEALLSELDHSRARRGLRTWVLATAGLAGVIAVAVPIALAQRDDQCAAGEERLREVWHEERHAAVGEAIGGVGVSFAVDAAARVQERLDDYGRAWAHAYRDACEATRVRAEQSEHELDLRMGCLERARTDLDATAHALSHGVDATVAGRAVQVALALPSLERCADAAALAAEVAPPADAVVAQRVVLLRARVAEAKALGVAGRYAAGLDVLALVAAEATDLGYAPLQAEVALREGQLRERGGEYGVAATSLERAHYLASAAGDDAIAAEAAAALVLVVGDRLADFERAGPWIRHSETLVHRVGSEAAEARHRANVGAVLFVRGRNTDALVEQERAVELWERSAGPDSIEVANGLSNLANTRNALGELEQARAIYERALSIREQVLGPEHPDCAIVFNNLGGIEYTQGHLEQAETLFARALAIRESAFGPDHPDVASTLGNLGNVASARGRHADARAHYERAVTVLERTVGDAHPKTLTLLNNLGALAMVERREADARAYFERALPIAESALGLDHPTVAAIVGNLGMLARAAGDLTHARPQLERSLSIRAATLGADHIETALTRIELSRLELAESRAPQARALAEQGLAALERRDAQPDDVARARFALAQALWSDPTQRPRALALAERAAQSVDDDASWNAELHAWLDQRRK